jgi:hypothetical protein
MFAGAISLVSANAAFAQECADDSDCDGGFSCQVAGTSGACAVPACAPDDADCAKLAPECGEPMEFKACQPAPCEEDSDCGGGNMVCHEYEQPSTCSGGTAPAAAPMMVCPDGQDCPAEKPAEPPPQPECTTPETKSVCTPRYVLPCEHDADCGAGFNCKERISMSCSGSGSAGSSSGGSTPSDPGAGGADGGGDDAKPALEPAPLPADETCTSEPTGEFYCELQEMPCDATADCPADFECVSNPNRAVCVSAGEPTTPSDGAAPSDPGAGGQEAGGTAGAGGDADPDQGAADAPAANPCMADDDVPAMVCLPKHYYESGGIGRGGAVFGNAEGGTAGTPPGDATGVMSPTVDKGAHDDGETAGPDDDEITNMGSDDDAGSEEDNASDGCSVAATGTHGANAAWGSLGLIGLSVLALRRRTRKAA